MTVEAVIAIKTPTNCKHASIACVIQKANTEDNRNNGNVPFDVVEIEIGTLCYGRLAHTWLFQT
jgi:hypothetical protein